MIKSRYIMSATVLIAVVLLCAVTIGLAPAYARISNVASWRVAYSKGPSDLESDSLSEDGQEIYLGSWEAKSGADAIIRHISLSSDFETEGVLSCSAESDTVFATLSEESITVGKDKKTVTLTISQTAKALSLISPEKATVKVTFTPKGKDESASEWADFTVTLCPAGTYSLHSGTGSNYLREDTRTVLLANWSMNSSSNKTLDIELVSDSDNKSGILSCTSDTRYITATLDNSTAPVSIKMNKGGKYIASLNLTPTQNALSISTEVDTVVRVSWECNGTTIGADFKVKLVPETAVYENAAVENTEIDLSGWKTTFDWNSLETFLIPCPENADTITVTYNNSSFPEGTRYSTDKVNYYYLGESMPITFSAVGGRTSYLFLDMSEAVTNNTQGAGSVIFGVAAYKNGTRTAYSSVVTEPRYNTAEELVSDNAIDSSVSLESKTAIQLTPFSNATHVRVCFNKGSFPKGTRYSLDGGKTYTLLGVETELSTPVRGGKTITAVFDFSRAEFESIPATVSFEITAYDGAVMLQSKKISAATDAEKFSIKADPSAMVISYNGSVEATVCGNTDGLKFKIERLESTNEGLEYVKSEDDYGIKVTVSEGKLKISNKAEKAKAGTYRLTVTRTHNGVEFERIEIPFFINYKD